MPGMTRWNPWRALRDREAIRFARLDLPDGVDGAHATKGERRAIVIDRALLRSERNAVLAHELIHDERGHLPPGASDLEVLREERRVDAEVARRLVPLDELRELVRQRVELGEQVTAADIAEHFDVPEWVARISSRIPK